MSPASERSEDNHASFQPGENIPTPRHLRFERLAALPTLISPPGVEGPAVGTAIVHAGCEKLSDVGTGPQNSDDDEECQGGLGHE